MTPTGRALGDVDSDWLRRMHVLDQFEERWQMAGEARIEDFLPAEAADGRLELLHELIQVDLEYCWKSGQTTRVEEYARRFPELGEPSQVSSELIREELRVRQSYGCAPSRDELAERFPDRVSEFTEAAGTPQVASTTSPTTDFSAPSDRVPSHAAELHRLGRYELRETVGRGGFSVVYRAWDPELRREVAIKVPRAEFVEHAELSERVLREARSAARLRHPAIVPIHEVAQEGNVPYIVYEYIPGPTLAQLQKQTNPAPQQAAEWVARIAEALDYAHQNGIVHRDVKPANILMDSAGAPMIADFGLALHADAAATLTQEGDILGTPAYMSPEQARGEGHGANARSDVYSLGVVLYELLSGRVPFQGSGPSVLHKVIHEEPEPPRSVRPGIALDLETICLEAMAKEPSRRYATAGAMADDLRRYVSHQPIRARRIGVIGRFVLLCRRKPALAATIALATVISASVASASFWRVLEERNRYRAEREQALANLYQSLVGEARAIRLARASGYRTEAWSRLKQAIQLDTPARDIESLRQEAVACMGDVVGLEPTVWKDWVHPAYTVAVALRPDGRQAALGFTDGVVVVRDTSSGAEVARLQEHDSGVFAVAFARDGRTLVSMDDGGTIKVWTANTATESSHHAPPDELPSPRLAGRGGGGEGIPGPTHGLDPSPQPSPQRGEGDIVTASPRDGSVTRSVTPTLGNARNYAPWTCSRTITTDASTVPGKVQAVSAFVTHDGKHLIACSKGQHAVSMWNLADGTPEQGFHASGNEKIQQLELSPDGKLLTASYEDEGREGVLIWDVATRQIVRDLEPGIRQVSDATISPDGKLLACAGQDGVALFDTSEFRRQTFIRVDMVFRVSFSPDSRLLAVPSHHFAVVRLWDVSLNREVAVLSHPEEPLAVEFSRDGGSLVSVAAKSVHIWNLRGNPEKFVLSGHDLGVTDVAFSSDGKFLASAGADRTVRIWDPLTGDAIGTLADFRGIVQNIALSPDGQLLATADRSGAIRIWDLASPAEPNEMVALEHNIGSDIWSAVFSPDRQYFAAAGGNGVALWRVVREPLTPNPSPRSGERGEELPLPSGGEGRGEGASLHVSFELVARPTREQAGSLSFSPNLKLLAWIGFDSLHLWNVAYSSEIAAPPDNHADLAGTAFLPDSNRLALVGPQPQIWDLTTQKQVASFTGFPVTGDRSTFQRVIALSRDGVWLAAQGVSVAVWDTRNQKPLLALPKETSTPWCLAWSPNRELLAIGSSDGGLTLWNLPEIRSQLDKIGLAW